MAEGSSRLPAAFSSGAREILGERFLTDDNSRGNVSTDWSMYTLLPEAVCRPANEEELSRLSALAQEEGVCFTLRGGGSGTGGAALSQTVVVELTGDFWEREPQLIEDGTLLRTAPGVSYTRIARLLEPLGRTIPADPSSAGISTIGGNIATRASGPHAFRHGSMDRYLHSLRVINSSGELIDTAKPPPEELSRGLASLASGVSRELGRRIRDHESLKSASGPRLLPFLLSPTSSTTLTSLYCGSLGAFGTVCEAIIRTHPLSPKRSVVLHAAADDQEAISLVEGLRGDHTLAIELVDAVALRVAGRNRLLDAGLLSERQKRILTGPQGHLLIQETDQQERVARTQDQDPLTDEQAQELWKLRKGMLWRMNRLNDRFRAYSVINDLAVPKSKLGPLIQGIREVARELRIPLPFYGHAGDANLHFRPLFRTDAPDLEERIRLLAESAYRLTADLGGTVTGEHGLGPLRAPFVELEWGREGAALFAALKRLFDPGEILNPGALTASRDFLEHFHRR